MNRAGPAHQPASTAARPVSHPTRGAATPGRERRHRHVTRCLPIGWTDMVTEPRRAGPKVAIRQAALLRGSTRPGAGPVHTNQGSVASRDGGNSLPHSTSRPGAATRRDAVRPAPVQSSADARRRRIGTTAATRRCEQRADGVAVSCAMARAARAPRHPWAPWAEAEWEAPRQPAAADPRPPRGHARGPRALPAHLALLLLLLGLLQVVLAQDLYVP